jgi:hypothetical protein
VHGYSAPVHTGDGWNQARQQHQANVPEGTDHFAFTTRGVLGLAFAFGDLMPPPPPPPVEPPPPPPPPPPAEREMEICIIDDMGNIQVVDAIFLPETGDTMVVVDGQRRAFATVYPTDARYAAGQRWFVDNEPIHVMDQRYVKTGLPRIIQPQELTRVGEYQGVSVFAQPGAETPPAVLYLPVRPGCEFQAYQARGRGHPRPRLIQASARERRSPRAAATGGAPPGAPLLSLGRLTAGCRPGWISPFPSHPPRFARIPPLPLPWRASAGRAPATDHRIARRPCRTR